MAEQQLDGAQSGAGFEQMCGPAVSNQGRRDSLTNAGSLRGLGTCPPHRPVADGLFGTAMRAGREQVGPRLEPAPVGAQGIEQRRAQGKIAVLVALAVNHMNDHAPAVDMVDLEPRDLGAAHTGAIENHQQRTLKQVAAGVDQTGNFFLAQNAWQLPLTLEIGQEPAELMAAKGAYEEELQRSHVVLYRSRAEFTLPKQVGLVTAEMMQNRCGEFLRRFAPESRVDGGWRDSEKFDLNY